MVHIEQFVFILVATLGVGTTSATSSFHLVAAGQSFADSAPRPHAPDAAAAAVAGAATLRGGLVISRTDQGGTACQCTCGDRVAWRRLLFPGNVARQKEWECEHEVCPNIIIPGLRVRAECTFVEDLAELIAGTVCSCQCGDKLAWRNQVFYGNVTEEKENECLTELCPRINPLPGVHHRAKCRFDPKLFSFPMRVQTTPPPSLQARASASMAPSAMLLLGALSLGFAP